MAARWLLVAIFAFAIIQASTARNVPEAHAKAGLTDQKNLPDFGSNPGSSMGGFGGFGGLPGFDGNMPFGGGSMGGMFPGIGGSSGSSGSGGFGSLPHP